MSDKKRRKTEENIYMDMGTPKLPEKYHKFPSHENIYEEIKSLEINQQIAQAQVISGVELSNDVPKFRDQQRPPGAGKDESPVVDLTCNCTIPCEGPCANGLVSKKVTLYESLLMDYQKEIQSRKGLETSIYPPPRKKKLMKRQSANENNPIKHSEAIGIVMPGKKSFAQSFSSSTLDATEDSRIDIGDDSRFQSKSEGFRYLFTSTHVNEGTNLFPGRNSSHPDLQTAGDIISISEGVGSSEEHSLQKQIPYSEDVSGKVEIETERKDHDRNRHISIEKKETTPKRPSRKKAGILFVHREDSSNKSDKQGKAHHAKFSFPAITDIKCQNELIKTSSSIHASVNILDWSKRNKGVPRTMTKADSVAALTQHEHENLSNLNVRRRLEKTKRVETVKKRINAAFGLQKSNSSCWPKVFKRKKVMKRMTSIKFMKRSAKSTSRSTESFATIFLSNERKMSTTLPENWKHDVISEDLFTTQVQESVEFPQHVSMPEVKDKNKRRTLRERLLSPRRLRTKESTTSLDSIALRKAISFLESSLHPSGSNNKNNTSTNGKIHESQSLNRQESDDSAGESSDTVDSITSAKSACYIHRTVSHDSSAEEHISKKISLKTKLFLRAASIPDMSPRILNAFSKSSSSAQSDDRDSNEVFEGLTKPGKFSNRLSNLVSLFSTETIKGKYENEAHGVKNTHKIDICTAEVHEVIDAQPISEVIKIETEIVLGNTVVVEPSYEATVIHNVRRPSIVVTEENLQDHLSTADNINVLSDSENGILLPVLAEEISLAGNSQKFATGSTNTKSKTLEDNLLSPQDILDEVENLNAENSFQYFGDDVDVDDNSGNISVKKTVTESIELENSSTRDGAPSSSKDNKNHESSEELDVCERSEIVHHSATENESTDSLYQIRVYSEDTIHGYKYPHNSEMPPGSTTLTNEKKTLKHFAVSILPLTSESTESKNEENLIVDHVLQTERCVDTGRTVITYNAPLDGEHVKIDLHEIDPNMTTLEKCVDTGRTVISCKAALDRLDSPKNIVGKVLKTSLVQEKSAGSRGSDPIVKSNEVLDDVREQCLHVPVDATSSDLNQFFDSVERSTCNDCESPCCGIPIFCIDTNFHQEDSVVSDELHREITAWKCNNYNEDYFKTNSRSNLMPPDDRRRIRANSIPESEFELEEECDDADSENVRKTIMDGLQNKIKLQNSEFTGEKKNDQNSSAEFAVPHVSSSDNFLNISMNDDFFDFFRDRAHEEHYAYILESDSENEEECAKAVVNYLANARRGSIDALLSPKTDKSSHIQSQKLNVETGSLSISDCSSRRPSKIEPVEPVEDDIFDFFGENGSIASKDETKCHSDISNTSDGGLVHQSGTKGHPNNLTSHVPHCNTTETGMPNDRNDIEIAEAFLRNSVKELNQVDSIASSESVNRNSLYGDDNKDDKNSRIEVSVNEDLCEKDFGLKMNLTETLCNDDKRTISAIESISDNCQVATRIEIDAQKTTDVEKGKIKMQSVVNDTDEVKIAGPETPINENKEKDNTYDQQKHQGKNNENFRDGNSTSQIEELVDDNKREIVRKENSLPNTLEDFSKRENKERRKFFPIVLSPSKPHRLFTVRLIPEDSWRSKSINEFRRNGPNSMQQEPGDLHVTKSFDNIPVKLHTLSHPLPENDFYQQNHLDARSICHIQKGEKNLRTSTPNSDLNNSSSSSNDEISLESSDSKCNARNNYFCPDETDDFFNYFKDNRESADDDIELRTEENISAEIKLSKTNDDHLEKSAFSNSQCFNSINCLQIKSNPEHEIITPIGDPASESSQCQANKAKAVQKDTDDKTHYSPSDYKSTDGSNLTRKSSTDVVVDTKVNDKEWVQNPSHDNNMVKDCTSINEISEPCLQNEIHDQNQSSLNSNNSCPTISNTGSTLSDKTRHEVDSANQLQMRTKVTDAANGLPAILERQPDPIMLGVQQVDGLTELLLDNVSRHESFENRVERIPDGLVSELLLSLPEGEETRKGSFLQENDDFNDYLEYPKCTSNFDSRAHAIARLDSDETSDVTGISILRPDIYCELLRDTVPMIKTKLAFRGQYYCDQLPKEEVNLNLNPDGDSQNCLPEHNLITFHKHEPSSLCEIRLPKIIAPDAMKDKGNHCSRSKNSETNSTQPIIHTIKQQAIPCVVVDSDIYKTDMAKIVSTSGNSSKNCDTSTNIDISSNGAEKVKKNEKETIHQGHVETPSVSEMVRERPNDKPYEDHVKVPSVDSHFTLFLPSTPDVEQNRSRSILQKIYPGIISEDSQTQTILCQQTSRYDIEIDVDGIIHTNDDTGASVIRSTKNSSDDLESNVTPFSSRSNCIALSEFNSDLTHVTPFELRQLINNNSKNEQLTGQLDALTDNKLLTSSLVANNEEMTKNIYPTEEDYQKVKVHLNDARTPSEIYIPRSEVPIQVLQYEINEFSEIGDSHHIGSILKKDNAGAGPRRRSVTYNLPISESPEPPESTIMVSYASNEDPFEYFSSCEPVSTALKDDPFVYFTTSSTVSASRDIVNDSKLDELENTTETFDLSASHNNGDSHQHDLHPHNHHRCHIKLLTIVEADPDLLAVNEASYETIAETYCTLNDGCDSQLTCGIDESQQKSHENDLIESVGEIPNSSKPAPSETSLSELKQSVNSIDSTKKYCGGTENTDAVSQQKPVILKLVRKEMSERTNDQEQTVRASSNELCKPSISECLIGLPVAMVFENIDAAEQSGSTRPLSKVSEELVTNSPQYQTKFKRPNESHKSRKESSSIPKTLSISHETLLDSVDDSCNRSTPFLPTYCHARKALFPNLSTSNLSTLEQMDDNYSPRSLALGRPTIILQTWFERQKYEFSYMKPARSSSDLVNMFSGLSVPQNTPSVSRSESLPPRKRPDTPSPGTPVDQFKEDIVVEQPPRQEERVQKDRSLDVYPETLRQRQRPRNMTPSPSKVDIKNWNQNGSPIREPESPASGKKFLPSVKALRSQFETGKNLNSSSNNGSVSPTSTFSMSSSSSNASTGSTHGCGVTPTSVGGGGLRAPDPIVSLSRKLSGSSLASSSLEKSSSNTSLNSTPSTENLLDGDPHDPDEPVEPIFCQFQKVDEELRELMSRPTSTSGWDPRSLLKSLYHVSDVPRVHTKGHSYINIEGYLEKLPSGRKKATFWNAWKRRYFVAKDGVLYYYQNSQCDKQSLRLTLMGGKVETMEGNMVGVDDGKGHYVVVRCSSRSEAERWRRALESHLVEDFASQYVQPHPMPTNPSLFRDTLIIDIGSCSVRAGVLSSQATLPQLFFPSVVATDRESRRQVWGQDALAPETRTSGSLSFPMKPSHRISKFSVDLATVSSLLTKTFSDLKVDPKNYNLQISVPRVLNQTTQSELLRTLFEKFGVKGVNVTHQSILALYAYNATSGIVVDIGERMDIVPVIDGYIVEGGVSRVPYGGCRILDHLRQFLYLRNVSLVNDVESYIIRHVLESACYCAQHYNTEKARCTNHPENFEKTVSLKEFFPSTAQCPYDAVELDFGRFQATEGLFNPDAWGLDHPGLHKLVHKAIQECSMDIRKEMSRSIFLAGGVTQLPGLADRLTTELDNLTPPAIRPKVHVSPYRYHAAYIGACTLAESPAFSQTLITRENWAKNGNAALRKWSL